MSSKNTELLLIEETKKLLDNFGEASALYATAEFAPFSNQQRPDLQFILNGLEDKVFFVEYNLISSNSFNESYIQDILEHKEFVVDGAEIEVVYAFATNAMIDQKFEDILDKHNITTFANIETPSELFNAILQWAKSYSSY